MRDLAGELGLAINTAARAYLDLARGLGLGKVDAARLQSQIRHSADAAPGEPTPQRLVGM